MALAALLFSSSATLVWFRSPTELSGPVALERRPKARRSRCRRHQVLGAAAPNTRIRSKNADALGGLGPLAERNRELGEIRNDQVRLVRGLAKRPFSPIDEHRSHAE